MVIRPYGFVEQEEPGMPFTPFHMGPALVAKAVLGRHFSIPIYAFTQVAIDSEVLAGYPFRRDLSFHKVMHTFAGATLAAVATLLLMRPALRPAMIWWNRFAKAAPGSIWHMEPWVPPLATALSVFGGAWVHVLLDAPTHAHMEPLAPMARGNPLDGKVTLRQTMACCVGLAAIGGAAILARSYLKGSRTAGKGPYRRGAARPSR